MILIMIIVVLLHYAVLSLYLVFLCYDITLSFVIISLIGLLEFAELTSRYSANIQHVS